MNRINFPRSASVALWLVALACVVYLFAKIYYPIVEPILEVLPPFATAFLLAFMLDPLVDRLQCKGLSRGAGVAVVGSVFLIAVVVVGILVVPLIARQAQDIVQNYDSYVNVATTRMDDLLAQHVEFLQRYGLPTSVDGWVSRYSPAVQSTAEKGLTVVGAALTSLFSRVLWLVIVPLSGLWLLKDIDYIRLKVLHLTPEAYQSRMKVVGNAVGAVFFKYLRGMATVAIIYSVAASLLFYLLGLNYWLIIGCISGVLYIVPYVGVLTTICIAAISVLVQPGHNLQIAAISAVSVAAMSFGLFDQVITPKVVGGSVGVHPVLSLFSLALGARLFGVVGVIIAVPIAAAIQVIIGEFYPKIYDRLQVPTCRVKISDQNSE